MDDAEKIIDEAGREGLQMSQGLLRLVLKLWDGARKDLQDATAAAKRLRVVSIASIIIAVLCLCVCVYQSTVIHKQGGEIKSQGSEISALRGEVESIHKILDAGVVVEETTTTTETTTTQTVDGDSATINNVDGEQYNDNAVNGGAD